MVGEQFDCGDIICGSVVNIRTKGDKISLWTKDAKNDEANRKIGYNHSTLRFARLYGKLQPITVIVAGKF